VAESCPAKVMLYNCQRIKNPLLAYRLSQAGFLFLNTNSMECLEDSSHFRYTNRDIPCSNEKPAEMQSWAVGKAVGNVRNQGPAFMEPIDVPETLKFE
jgi:hypothetical protein